MIIMNNPCRAQAVLTRIVKYYHIVKFINISFVTYSIFIKDGEIVKLIEERVDTKKAEVYVP